MGYLHNRGDYGRYRGDPGLLSSLGGVLGGVVTALVPGGSIVASGIRAITGGSKPIMRPAPATISFPGVSGLATMGGKPGKVKVTKDGTIVRSRRRMNVTNAKALRRAIRRTDGFVKLAKRALKGTGYTVSRRGSTRRGPTTIVETGAGSVHTR